MQKCGALKPRIRDVGWECTGRGLIVVSTFHDVPIVLPARALDVIEPESWWDLPIQRFAGGDHLHLTVPRRPAPRFETDTLLTFGDSATRSRHLGDIKGDGDMFISGPL